MNPIKIFLRVFLGITFIASAILKLFPIEAFDARILETTPFLGWTFSMIMARIIIACELVLGIFIVAGVWLKRVIYPLTLLMLGLFTSILIYSFIRFGNESNCGCFGELLPFSNIQSLLKNGLIIVITLFLYCKAKSHTLKYWWVGVSVLAVSVFIIFMLHKIPLYLDEIKLKEPFASEYVNSDSFQIEGEDLYQKHLVVFLSCACPKCKDMVRNFETMNRIYSMQNVYYYLYEDSLTTSSHLFAHKEISFPYKIVSRDTFFTYIPAPYLPLIGLVDSGKYTRIWTGANFDFDRVTSILKEEKIIE
ncbi:MAG: DoxX family protein [Bacteroidales bacterium]|jgi:uncharacterized membrane protein YphA (DoxX/SURF4 family)|nr:DoxX family protein [Bacteroidales bacterium]